MKACLYIFFAIFPRFSAAAAAAARSISSMNSPATATRGDECEILEFLTEKFLSLTFPAAPSPGGSMTNAKKTTTLNFGHKMNDNSAALTREKVNWSQRTLIVEGFGKLAIAAKR